MAALHEVPFDRYYGSVDATPLFVLLAGAYLERTGDEDLIQQLWPAIERALAWIDGPGDSDGDGFIEYARGTESGLANQGWKDSYDAVFHADGTLAHGPIALVEVQGYVYAAKHAAAACARRLGFAKRGAELQCQADDLRERFERTFWCEDIGTYALALDGTKSPCRVRTSNAGQVLFTGIAAPERAGRIAASVPDGPLLLGLGHPHRRPRRGTLQSDVVSQRLHLAARQRPHRPRPDEVRLQHGRRKNLRRADARNVVHGLSPHPRALLWLQEAPRARPDDLSRCLFSPGLGCKRTVFAAGVHAWNDLRRQGPRNSAGRSGAAGVGWRGYAAKSQLAPGSPPTLCCGDGASGDAGTSAHDR